MIQDSVTAAVFPQILTVDSFVANDFSDLHSPYAPAQSAPTAHSESIAHTLLIVQSRHVFC